jgi:hypothetical protein
MKRFFTLVIFTFLGFSVHLDAQVFFGMHKDQIKLAMKEQKELKLESKSVNKGHKYLKYTDNLKMVTLLIFLGNDDKCTYSKMMCDYSLLDNKTAFLNKNYKKKSSSLWEGTEKNIPFSVSMTKEEWYFSLTYKPR